MFSPLPPTRPSWAERARRALDTVVAFATLADVEPVPEPAHPHRTPLRSPLASTARRPGVPQPRLQVCLTATAQRGRAAAPATARRLERRV